MDTHIINNPSISVLTHVSNGVPVSTTTEHRYSVDIIVYSTGPNKLSLLKCLKEVTGYGLKEMKEIVDKISTSPQRFVVPLTASEINRTKLNLFDLDGCKFEMSDINKVRDTKLIQLGLYENKEQLIDVVVESDIFSIFANKDIEYIKTLIKSRYSLLSEEDLLKILNNQVNG